MRIDVLTGCRTFSSTMGLPRLIDVGTSRLDGICPVIGMRSDFSTSLSSNPTLESERLMTTRHRSRGYSAAAASPASG